MTKTKTKTAGLHGLAIELTKVLGGEAVATKNGAALVRKAKGKAKAAPKAKKAAPKTKAARKAKAKPAAKAGAPRASKQGDFIAAMRTATGISIGEAAERFGWQQHTVRGAVAGALKKKLGLTIDAERDEKRGTVYRIK